MKKFWLVPVLLIGTLVFIYYLVDTDTDVPPLKVDRYNLLLISIDTLRADHLGCYGYERDTSPGIDELAKDAVLFENAIIPAPYTGPSHATMMTGLYPAAHGVLTNGYRLHEETTTLAERLRGEGFKTAAFVAAKSVLGKRFGFNQGFEVFKQGLLRQRRAAKVNRDALRWLERTASSERFFAWVHYYDVHCAYRAPQPFFDMFYPDYGGELDPRGKCGKPHYNNMELSEDDFEYLRALYDGELRYVDTQVAALLTRLEELRLKGKTIVVITSDHGESLGEQRLIGHNLCLHDYEIRIPLIINHPGLVRGARVRHQVDLVSLTPTILDLLGIPADNSLDGESFAGLLRGERAEERFAYSQIAPEKGREQAFSIRGQEWKFILHADGREELFLLGAEAERTNRVGTDSDKATSMRQDLQRWISTQRAAAQGKTQELSADVIEQLKALGYVSQ